MQTIVCQTDQAFSPELAPQPQSLQRTRQDDAPRESDFLSMLNQSLREREEEPADSAEPVKEAEPAKAAQEEPKTAKAEDAQKSLQESGGEKGRDERIEKTAKKEEPAKVDAFIQGALVAREQKKPEVKAEAKTESNSKVEQKSGQKKIDPKQLEFLRQISQKASEKESQGLEDFAKQSQEGAKNAAELSFPAESLLAGQKVVRDAPDFTYAQEDGAQSKEAAGSKVSELKKNSKKPVIQVTDLRTKVEAAVQKEGSKDIKKSFVTTVKQTEKGAVQMTLDLNDQAQKNILSLDSQSAASDGSTFQAMLKNQITQNAGDFVKAANIVLRDNDQGQINLILHPEELGNVKISMEVHGKEIVGHITVSSREAMEAFGQSADALKNSFLQSGFENAKFDVSFAGSQMQFAQGNASGQEDNGRAQQGRKIYGDFTQESLTSVSEISDNFIDDDVSVNIVA